MNCCRHSVFGLTDSMADPVTEQCDLSAELAALGEALEKADALGLYQDSLVVSARAIYEATSVTSISRASCAQIGSNLRSMAARVESLVIANMPPEARPGAWEQLQLWLKGLPRWALPVAGAVTGALVLTSTAGGVFARRKRRGRR